MKFYLSSHFRISSRRTVRTSNGSSTLPVSSSMNNDDKFLINLKRFLFRSSSNISLSKNSPYLQPINNILCEENEHKSHSSTSTNSDCQDR